MCTKEKKYDAVRVCGAARATTRASVRVHVCVCVCVFGVGSVDNIPRIERACISSLNSRYMYTIHVQHAIGHMM